MKRILRLLGILALAAAVASAVRFLLGRRKGDEEGPSEGG